MVALIHRHTNPLGTEPGELLAGVGHIWTGGIAKGVAATAIALGQHVTQRHGLGIWVAQLAANARVDRRDPALLDTLAHVHAERGERDRAVQAWKDALALLDAQPAPKQAEAASKLAAFKATVQAAPRDLSADAPCRRT